MFHLFKNKLKIDYRIQDLLSTCILIFALQDEIGDMNFNGFSTQKWKNVIKKMSVRNLH